MYVITAHQRYRRTDGRTDGQTDAKRWHDRSIAILAWSGKNQGLSDCSNSNSKNHGNVHGVVIMALPLPEFTRFIQ